MLGRLPLPRVSVVGSLTMTSPAVRSLGQIRPPSTSGTLNLKHVERPHSATR